MKRALIVVLMLALGLFVAAPRVFAAAGTPRGEVADGTYGIGVATQTGEDAIAIPLASWQNITPADIVPYLGHPTWHVNFDTPDGAQYVTAAYVQSLITPWLPTIAAHSNIDWQLVIGNEPNNFWTTNGETVRAAYINLWNNYLARLAQQYPMLHIYAALGTNYSEALAIMQFYGGPPPGYPNDPAGGIRDMYYGMSMHVYADDNFAGIDGGDTNILNYLEADRYTAHFDINELGIDNCGETMLSKAEQYQAWIDNTLTSGKVTAVTAFTANNSAWPCYNLNTDQYGQIIGDHWVQ